MSTGGRGRCRQEVASVFPGLAGGGSKGKTFSLTARIFAVVDVWYALSSDRPYRPARTIGAKYHLTTSCRHNSGTVLALERERLLALMEDDPEPGTRLLWNIAAAMSHRVRFILWQLNRAQQRA